MRSRILIVDSNSRLFFGDPCYVLSREDYDSAVIDNPDLSNQKQPEVVEGRDAAGNVITVFCDTKYGDGEYPSKSGRYFGVDAGILGVSLITDDKYDSSTLNDLGLVVDVPENAAYVDVFAERDQDYNQGDVYLSARFFDETGRRIDSVETVIYTAEDEEDKSDDYYEEDD